MLRFVALVLAVFVSLPAVAAPSKSSAGISSAPAKSVAPRRKTGNSTATFQFLGGSNRLSGEISGSVMQGTGASATTTSTSGSSVVNGISAGVILKTSDYIAWEADFGVLSRGFKDDRIGGRLADAEDRERSRVWNVRSTGMARYYVDPRFSFGAGLFGSHFLGPIRTESRGRGNRTSFEQANMNRSELGFAFGGRFQLPINADFEFTADARYLMGVTNLMDTDEVRTTLRRQLADAGVDEGTARAVANGTNASLYTRDFQFAAGVGYRF